MVQDKTQGKTTYAAGQVQPQFRHSKPRRGGPTREDPQSSDLLLAGIGTCCDRHVLPTDWQLRQRLILGVQLASPNRRTLHTVQLSGMAIAAKDNTSQVQKGARQHAHYSTTAAGPQRDIAGSEEIHCNYQSRHVPLRKGAPRRFGGEKRETGHGEREDGMEWRGGEHGRGIGGKE